VLLGRLLFGLIVPHPLLVPALAGVQLGRWCVVLAAIPGGGMVDFLGTSIDLSINGRGGGRSGARVVAVGGAGRVLAVGRVTRLGLLDLL